MNKNIIMAALINLLVIASTGNLPAQDTAKAAALATNFKKGVFEISHYNTACYFALAGNRSLAMVYLRKAIEDGFANAKAMQEDTDLSSLHNEGEWPSLVKLTQTNELSKANEKSLFFNQPNFWESTSLKSPYRVNITEDEKIAGLSKFWSEAKYNFVNFDLIPKINIDSLYFAYLPKVKGTKSTLDYYKVLAEMCAQLKDGHTNVYPPEELYSEVYARPLVRTRLIEDKILVVEADKSIREKGIREGMEIVMVNGLPVKAYANKFVTPYQSSSTPQDRDVRSYDNALLAGSIKQPIYLKLKDQQGKIYDDTISRVSPAERSAKLSYPVVEYKVLPGNISYLAINSFNTDSGSKAFAKSFAEISKSKALILDLRNNGGGSTDWGILRYLIDTTTLVHKMYSRQYIPTHRAWHWPQSTWQTSDGIAPLAGQRYSNPVILLVSARTYSAAEDFAAAFKSLKLGLIIGEATGGSTGQPLGITLPGNLSARICTKRDRYPNGEDFVGKGVSPDIIVAPTVSDFRKGIDTQLEAALKQLKK